LLFEFNFGINFVTKAMHLCICEFCTRHERNKHLSTYEIWLTTSERCMAFSDSYNSRFGSSSWKKSPIMFKTRSTTRNLRRGKKSDTREKLYIRE
jgi:hypothetical protein